MDGALSTFLFGKQRESQALWRNLLNLAPGDSATPVLIFSNDPSRLNGIPGLTVRTVLGNVVTADATNQAIGILLNTDEVLRVELPRVAKPLLNVSVPEIGVPAVWGGSPSYQGRNVIVGIYDTGIDLAHADFKDSSDKTRVLFLWDQTASSGAHPQGYSYGAEYTKAQIDAGSCPEQDTNGHGTHMAGSAAGDGSSSESLYVGVAKLADLIVVKGGNGSFLTDKIIDGINYIAEKARALGKSAVINLSLGSHFGSHDGKGLDELAIDAASQNGLIVVAAAGNEGDLRIHAGGSLSQGQPLSRAFTIPTYSANSGAGNDYCLLGIWYPGTSTVNFTISDPNGGTHGPIAPGDSLIVDSADGYLELRNGVGGVNPLNGLREIEITIFDAYYNKPPRAGTWTITLDGNDGVVDSWIYDSSMDAQFDQASWDNQKQVSIPGTATRAITVGAYTTKVCWAATTGSWCFSPPAPTRWDFAPFSSQGPTRDGRQKPEISAPGLLITSSRSADALPAPDYDNPDGKHTGLYGTSMAAPHITGVVALMLEKFGSLTPEDVRYHLTTTARTDQYTGTVWNKFWGYGKVDAEGAVAEVRSSASAKGEAFQISFRNPSSPPVVMRARAFREEKLTVKIYTVDGKLVASILNERVTPGELELKWDGRDTAGRRVPSALYLVRVNSARAELTKKIVLFR
ncbi:MAG: S8 family serine peptidase [Candidatus Eisenbacteria bacterium]|nr:S8 family serine peptidase [Candidatus Eisenbacteria bacterium]